MPSDDPDYQTRRAARAEWRVTIAPLSALPDMPELIAPEIALGMMWQLAQDSWAMAGRSIPDYSRGQMPIKRIVPGEADTKPEP